MKKSNSGRHIFKQKTKSLKNLFGLDLSTFFQLVNKWYRREQLIKIAAFLRLFQRTILSVCKTCRIIDAIGIKQGYEMTKILNKKGVSKTDENSNLDPIDKPTMKVSR